MSLLEEFIVEFVAVADDESFSASECGCAESPAATGDQCGQFRVAEPFGFHVDVSKGPSACDVEVRGLSGERHGVACVDGFLSCVGLFADSGIGLGKEPLRFDTAGSALAVVVPIDACGHESRSLVVVLRVFWSGAPVCSPSPSPEQTATVE